MKKALRDKDTVVALGKKAQEGVKAAGFKGEVMRGSHPSDQNLNRNYKSKAATPAARRKDRIRQQVDDLLKD